MRIFIAPEAKIFLFFHGLQTLSLTHAAPYVMGTGDLSLEKRGRGVKLLVTSI